MPNWPVWWSYNLVISPHVIDRMKDRDFGEVDLRTLLEDAVDFRPSLMPGRFCISSRREMEKWEVVVEPDELERNLIVVTAYRVE